MQNSKIQRVRTGARYVYHPVPMDRFDPKCNAQDGDVVTVVAVRGCPQPNVMGHCHIEVNGKFAGLVHCNSLTPIAKYMARVREIQQNHAEATKSLGL